jgi:ribonucleoside-diphosphate reductase alpha chain
MGHPMIIKRNGQTVAFDSKKIVEAIKKAYIFDADGQKRANADSAAIRQKIEQMGSSVVDALITSATRDSLAAIRIESIQDMVELFLMRTGEHDVARDFVLFRDRRARERSSQKSGDDLPQKITVQGADCLSVAITLQSIQEDFLRVLAPFDMGTRHQLEIAQELATAAIRELYEGCSWKEYRKALALTSRARIERDPVFSKVTAAILLEDVYNEVIGESRSQNDYFATQIKRGISIGMYDPDFSTWDIERLAAAIVPDRDLAIEFLGLQTLCDRYLIQDKNAQPPVSIEMPQGFFMRVAMGLAKNEIDREERAIEFYNVLSSFDFINSTPTLFNAGTRHPQLSSCYLTTISDDLDGIYEGIKENALLQKFAGGLGNDWTQVRAMGSHIKGTNGESQGVIPFLKVANDTAVAVNQGGKRKGAVCAYMETWHLDIEEFLNLRKNTGDDRRRTHDMNTANWIPDLFMKRVMENAEWTLFSPSDVPDLHDLYGREFEKRYVEYEVAAARGSIRLYKRVEAVELWRKMLGMIFETGHPWINFKDPCNIRSPQKHVGVVHSSNLCTEITLNTSDSEIAVCNLGSVNLVNHIINESGVISLDVEKLRRTVNTAMRMLDNVIDINYYAVKKARTSNLMHRPVGLGWMGFQDLLHLMRVPYASQEAVRLSSMTAEVICHAAYGASTYLAQERGAYSSFKGSLWDQGVLPQDSVALVTVERGEAHHEPVEIDSGLCDWSGLRERIRSYGMRNSNCVAVAPTATISNIVGVSASIEPAFQNLFVKSNLSGEFTVINANLVSDLRERNLWDEMMISDLKFYDGELAKIDRVPSDLKALYATAYEIDPKWLVESASARGRWIDQSQSLNIYMAGASGKKIDELYKLAWRRGLKTTYYLRTKAATAAEKSTGNGGELNAVKVSTPSLPLTTAPSLVVASVAAGEFDLDTKSAAFCSIEDVMNGTCESCQ